MTQFSGNCPLFNRDGSGKVGIMQVPDPTLEQAWNWQENIKRGIELFNEKVEAARSYPGDVRRSPGFKGLLKKFNDEKRQGEKPLAEIILRDFNSGSFENDTLDELELDAIRGYNGWPEDEADIFGLGLHEFRVAFEDRDKQILLVESIEEDPLTGELAGQAVWERVPVSDRPKNVGDPNYVNRVLSYTTTCLPADPVLPLEIPTIQHVFLMLDDFTKPLDWNEHIIGLHFQAQRINIQIQASNDLNDPSLSVELTTRAANRMGDSAGAGRKQFEVFKDPAASQGADRAIYRRSLRIDEFDPEPGRSAIREVATIHRALGTSDEVFRDALGWSPRGVGSIPLFIGGTSGSEDFEIPDAIQLLRAGGVEVLDVKIIEPPPTVGMVLESQVSRLIRSPADIVYYTGHGVMAKNCLIYDPQPGRDHVCWADWRDLISWTQVSAASAVGDFKGKPEVLMIAGCSVLKIFRWSPGRFSPRWELRGPGLAWAQLLRSKKGPLRAILGYAGLAPFDDPIGNLIAEEMGEMIANTNGSLDYVREWLKINAKYHAWNAVGLDLAGYWQLGRGLILGPIPV